MLQLILQNQKLNKLQVLPQKAFGDGDVAYMALAPVNRAIFKTNKVNEYYRIEYFFQNITFTTDRLTTSNNWASASNGVMNMAKLDINKYDYLVTNNGALIVNKGSFANVFTDATTINWGAGGTDVADIKTIISKVALTDAEAQMLTRFTNLTSIELAKTLLFRRKHSLLLKLLLLKVL